MKEIIADALPVTWCRACGRDHGEQKDYNGAMADSLYLSLWFPSFREGEMMSRTVGVLRQFPYSALREGITYLSVHPVAWSEPTVLERRFNPGISPEEAADLASEFAHDDFALVFEAFWDLWVPSDDEHGDSWVQRPVAVRFLVHGAQFDDGIYSEDGHIEVDFGLDTSFVYEGARTSSAIETHLRSNIAKLVAFSTAVEKNCVISGRVLWSESEENLAQKLLAKLQQTQ
jgi:hypothetical protein